MCLHICTDQGGPERSSEKGPISFRAETNAEWSVGVQTYVGFFESISEGVSLREDLEEHTRHYTPTPSGQPSLAKPSFLVSQS
jgi:hypothetical protein